MKICDMCLKEWNIFCDYNTEFTKCFDPIEKSEYLLCGKCQKKIQKYIKFERARAERGNNGFGSSGR